jgi:hypothetical protein
MTDHLETETSVSVDLTETGITAKAKSRFVAAVDRLGGNLLELANAPLERRVAKQRAISAGEVKLLEAVTAYGIEKLQHDPEFAGRAIGRYFDRVFQKQVNKDQVLLEALEDLRHDPPSEAASTAGKTELEEEFLNRFEQYAEGASTEQLRQKWGRVLSAEIRAPGTFSVKVLRTVDEIDAQTAKSFEEVCEPSFNNVILKCLSGKLEFGRQAQLVMAGLLIDPGLAGHIAHYVEGKNDQGIELWVFRAADRAVSFPKGTPIPPNDSDSTGPVIDADGKPSIPVYLLTDAGAAIAEIFSRQSAFPRYVAKLRDSLAGVAVREYTISPNGSFVPVA